VPYGGRNFESFGEDPYLMAEMTVPIIEGIQSKNVATCTKHFVANNQEWNRFDVSAEIDERTLREIYFPAFKAAVQRANTYSVMGGYNRVNGTYANESKYLLNDVLKEDWGFDGVVISDWGAVKTTLKTAEAGMDLEMPNGKYLGEKLLTLIKNGEVKESILDDKIRRILRIMFRMGLFNEDADAYGGYINSDDKFSVRWTGKFKSPGSGQFEVGVKADNGVKLFIDGNLVINSWTDQAPGQFKTDYYEFEEGKLYDIKVEFYENIGTCRVRFGIAPVEKGNELQEAIDIAKEADVVVLNLGMAKNYEGEQRDRDYLELPPMQIKLFKEVLKVNKNVVVVLNNGSAMLMNDWNDKVPAIVEALYPGEQGGKALAQILFGEVNPSGKLPFTIMKKWEDHPAGKTYPGEKDVAYYSEGIFMGYRHFDKYDIDPLYEFGFGLSYTTFEFSDLKLSKTSMNKEDELIVELTVKNSGKVDGDEIVQLYISDKEASVEREVKSLKGFARVSLKSGESKTVSMKIDKSALAFYDVKSESWVVEPGEFEVLVGNSSRNILLNQKFKIYE